MSLFEFKKKYQTFSTYVLWWWRCVEGHALRLDGSKAISGFSGERNTEILARNSRHRSENLHMRRTCSGSVGR